MTMSLSGDGGLDAYYLSESHTPPLPSGGAPARSRSVSLPLIEGKLRQPEISPAVERTRLLKMLERSINEHTGTLLIGRAGSGKTTLAADLARRMPTVAWYSIDAGDSDWDVFCRYFQAMLFGKERYERASGRVEDRTPPELFATLLARLDEWPRLLVLDGMDHLFDSEWFKQFFDIMMASLPPQSHVLVLSRTRPPNPLWRLRSKQVINVIDEKLLAFSLTETEKLFALHGRRGRGSAAAAHKECYGRAGKLLRYLDTSRTRLTD